MHETPGRHTTPHPPHAVGSVRGSTHRSPHASQPIGHPAASTAGPASPAPSREGSGCTSAAQPIAAHERTAIDVAPIAARPSLTGTPERRDRRDCSCRDSRSTCGSRRHTCRRDTCRSRCRRGSLRSCRSRTPGRRRRCHRTHRSWRDRCRCRRSPRHKRWSRPGSSPHTGHLRRGASRHHIPSSKHRKRRDPSRGPSSHPRHR